MKTYEERRTAILVKASARQERRRIVVKASLIAASILLALQVLFAPYDFSPPSVSQYASSPYYAVIERVNASSYRPPTITNNFQKIVYSLRKAFGSDKGGVAGEGSIKSETYVEVTDNQVAGIIESDTFKRTDRYLYHLNREDDTLCIYTIDGERSQRISSYPVMGFVKEKLRYLGGGTMFLSADGKTVTLILPIHPEKGNSYTVILNLDVTDPENVYLTSKLMLGGSASARLIDGKLILLAKCYLNANFDKPSTLVPQYGWLDDIQYVQPENVIVPDAMVSGAYALACIVDAATLEMRSCKALLAYDSYNTYISENGIYFASTYWKNVHESPFSVTSRQFTQVTGLSYEDGILEEMGSVVLEGAVLNQYSLDEYQGVLRVVTSTTEDEVETIFDTEDPWDFSGESKGPRQKSVNLYCVDLETWTVAGVAESFAPKGEEATSVRFEGDTAYVCTAEIIRLTDPVFFFDLSDPENITWTETGTIAGYSTSLIDFGENTLLGIGFGEHLILKVEVYQEIEGKVVPVATYTQNVGFSNVYKSYYIDRENGLLGMAVVDRYTKKSEYLLLRFDGTDLVVEKRLPYEGWYYWARAVMIDGYLYILGKDLTVEKI